MMLRTTALITTMALALAAPAAAQELTRDDVESIVLETLTQNPELLVEALRTINEQQLQARAELEARETRIREIAANEIGAPISGNPDGDITIVLFTDYNCPQCREAHNIVHSVVEQDENIRIVYRDLPLMNDDSVYAAKAALAADAQGKYVEFHNALMEMEAQANVNTVLTAALGAGVDLNQMMVGLDTEEISTLLEDTRTIAQEFGIEGSPTFFIGTTIANGTPTTSKLREIIAQERGE